MTPHSVLLGALEAGRIQVNETETHYLVVVRFFRTWVTIYSTPKAQTPAIAPVPDLAS